MKDKCLKNRKVWQTPMERQEFEYDGDMYKIVLEDGSDLLVSPEHKVYAAINQNLSSISLGDKTFDGSSFLSTLSPEKIGQSNLSESARYCTSFKCEESNFLASGKNSEKSDLGINVICFNTNFSVLSKISSDNLDLLNICSLCLFNSFSKNSGAIKSNFANKLFNANTLNESPLVSNEDRMTLTSTTTSILNQERYLLDKDSLILSENSCTSSSVNFDLESPLCNSTISSNLSLISFPTKIDQSIFEVCLRNFNSSGIFTTMSSIELDNEDEYKKLSVEDFSLNKITDVYSDFNSGKEIYFLDNLKNEEKRNIDGIILFGSVAKDEAERESDIDIFIEVKKKTKKIQEEIKRIKEKFYHSREASLFKLKGIVNEFNIKIGKLEEWKDLERSIASTGIILYGPYETKKLPSGVKHFVIVFWNKIGKNRGAFLNKIYGFKIKNKHYEGLISKFSGKKLGKSCLMLPIKYKKDILGLLKQYDVEAKIIEVFG